MSRPSDAQPAPADSHDDGGLTHFDPVGLEATRRTFWHNVVREMLNSLAVLAQLQPELFDGRFAVLTMRRERIPIGSVMPVFACSIPGGAWEREASVAVQCSVFRVTTPDGEVFTLPVHEVRAFHELTPELIKRIEESARAAANETDSGPATAGRTVREEGLPFGFAAFSAMPRLPARPAPIDPME